jgi:hypothetical protein
MDEFRTYKYAGGNQGSHYNYWRLCFKNEPLPSHEDKCVCGQNISENCYITKETDDEILLIVLGNCCIKKFIPKAGRTCEDCEAPHKNRVLNKCNECKKGICYKCFKKFKSYTETRTYCYECKPSYW